MEQQENSVHEHTHRECEKTKFQVCRGKENKSRFSGDITVLLILSIFFFCTPKISACTGKKKLPSEKKVFNFIKSFLEQRQWFSSHLKERRFAATRELLSFSLFFFFHFLLNFSVQWKTKYFCYFKVDI